MKTLLLLSAFAAGSASSALAAETRVLDCDSVSVYATASPAGQVHAVLERDDRVSPGLCEFLPE